MREKILTESEERKVDKDLGSDSLSYIDTEYKVIEDERENTN